jgi:hypothetical protein
MGIDRVSSFISQSDSVLEYIPVIGAAVSFYRFGEGLRDSYIEGSHIERKFEYLEAKSFSRFIVLLIPVFGNLIVVMYDFKKQIKAEFLMKLSDTDSSESNMGSFERDFERIRRETVWLPGHGHIVQLPVQGEGGCKQFRKAYCIDGSQTTFLAQTEYRPSSSMSVRGLQEEDEEEDGIEEILEKSEHTKALSALFTEKGWSREGTEIPFGFHHEGRIREYANLQTPWEQWMQNAPSKEEQMRALRPVVTGLKNLHANNIAHRDIKPANIVLDANLEGKLIDWDSWYDCTNPEMPGFTATPGFLAPDWVKNGADLKAVDVFALGITLYVIFQPVTLKLIPIGIFGSQIIKQSEELTALDQLILEMTSPDPLQRPTMAQVAERFLAIA